MLILLLLSFDVGGHIAVFTHSDPTGAYLISMATLHLFIAFIKYVFDRNFELITQGRSIPKQPNLPLFYIIISATATMIMLIGMLRFDLPIWLYAGVWLCSLGGAVLVWALLYELGKWFSTCWFSQFIYRWEEGIESPAFVFPGLTFNVSGLRKFFSALKSLGFFAIIVIAVMCLMAFGLLHEFGRWLSSTRANLMRQNQKTQIA